MITIAKYEFMFFTVHSNMIWEQIFYNFDYHFIVPKPSSASQDNSTAGLKSRDWIESTQTLSYYPNQQSGKTD